MEIGKISKISLGKESSDGMKYKIVETTFGTFKTRCCVYNQHLENLDDRCRSDTSKSVQGPPIKVVTISYDTEFMPRRGFLFVKLLTKSYETGEDFYGYNVFLGEVEYLKDKLESFDKVPIINFRLPKSRARNFTKEDIIAMVSCLIKTNSPHITIPLPYNWTFEECEEVISKLKEKISNEQDFFISINPNMNILEQKTLLESLSEDEKFRGVLMSCCTPYQVSNAASFNQASNLIGNNRLLMVVDTNDNLVNQSAPLPLILRSFFNVDVTCRNVWDYMDGDGFDIEYKKRKEEIKWYDIRLGGFIKMKHQKLLAGTTFDEFLREKNYKNITNLNPREVSMLFNFWVLNHEGKMERRLIDEDSYSLFLKSRPVLSNAVDKLLLKVSDKKIK